MELPLVYSFRTNKHLEEFRSVGIDVFVFGKMREDLNDFFEIVKKERPKIIIGLAEVKTKSRFETLAVNAFGKDKKINKLGKDSYSLFVPHTTVFSHSRTPTRSFCNWTAYKISEGVDREKTKVLFLHFNAQDISDVCKLITSNL